MEGLLAPTLREKALGRVEIRETFSVSKVGTIAGCYVLDGKVLRGAQVRLVRDNVVVWQGKMSSLKRFKDDAREVAAGYECGIGLENYNDLKIGDIIEVFEMEEVKTIL
jgi:translation initiation factor IF-2